MKRIIYILFSFLLIISLNYCKKENILINNDNSDINDFEITYETLSLVINNVNIEFIQFPISNVWYNEEHNLIFDTDLKKYWETRILERFKYIQNFNGKYRIVEFGTGSGVQYFFVIDLNNGNIYEGITSTHGIKYTVDSSLIIINDPNIILYNWEGWTETIPKWVTIEYYIWENNKFKKLLEINPY